MSNDQINTCNDQITNINVNLNDENKKPLDDIVNTKNETGLKNSSDSENINEKDEKESPKNHFQEEDTDFKLPEVDWDNLEAKLKEAQIEFDNQNKRSFYQNTERDEIRRKLAIVSQSSSTSSFNENYSTSDYYRKTNNSKTNYLGQNLQICFMNELQNDDCQNDKDSVTDLDEQIVNISNKKPNISKKSQISNLPVFCIKENASCDDLLSQHLKLQTETKEALANVHYSVQLNVDKYKEDYLYKNASPIADIVGLKTYGLERLTREHIVDMNIGQLQVIANDLCNQIENTNENLKLILTDRDDFCMQQDSFLVDIEDISKRIQEYAIQIKNNSNKDLKSSNKLMSSNYNGSNSVSENTTRNNQKSKFSHFNMLTNRIYQFANRKS